MSVKNKTLLLIIFTLTAFSVSLFYVVQIQQEKKINIIKNLEFENIKKSYESISKKYKNYYTDIIIHDLNEVKVKDAIRDENREVLYKLVKNKYKVLKDHNRDLTLMNFYLPDGTFFLDMNNPNSLYKNMSSLLVMKAQKNKKKTFGYEQYDNSLLYKSIHPIFYGKEYIGSLELGINSEYVLKDMKKYVNVEGIMINKVDFSLYKTTDNMEVVNLISKSTINTPQNTIYGIRGNAYIIYSFDLKNSENIPLVKFHFISNITKKIGEVEKDLLLLATALASMVLVTLIIVNFVISRSLKTLDNRFDSLSEFTDMIDNNIMIVDVSADFVITGVSQLFCDISGYSKDELIGKNFETLKDPDTPKELFDTLHKELEENGVWSGDLQNRTKDGQKYWLSAKVEAKYRDGKLLCYDYIMHNITAKKINEEIVYIDELTQTYNRKHFNDVFPRMVNGIKRNGGCVNFIVLDIDDFKKYNEIYGHSKGDEALVSISKTLKASLRRPDDYCFRLGGGEFGILFRSGSEDEGVLYAQVLKKNIEMIGIKHVANLTYKVLTASLGLVSQESHKIESDKDIYQRAYEHLRRAKDDGRNKVISSMI